MLMRVTFLPGRQLAMNAGERFVPSFNTRDAVRQRRARAGTFVATYLMLVANESLNKSNGVVSCQSRLTEGEQCEYGREGQWQRKRKESARLSAAGDIAASCGRVRRRRI